MGRFTERSLSDFFGVWQEGEGYGIILVGKTWGNSDSQAYIGNLGSY